MLTSLHPTVWRVMIALLAVGMLKPSALADEGSRPTKPNVVLILADDLGWQDVGCYDIDEPSPFATPHLDRLATRGVKFWQAYSPSPTCAPSRVAILTGKDPARSQKTHVLGGAPPAPYVKARFRMMPPWYSGRMNLEEVTIAEALKSNGYVTGHSGKWHAAINHHAFPQPADQGFDFSRHNLGVSARMKPDRLSEFATSDPGDPYRMDKDGWPFDQTNDDALAFIAQNSDRPFFLYYAAWLVHAPIQTRSEELLKKYAGQMGVAYPQDPDAWTVPGQKNPYYAAMVEELDQHVGRVLNHLESNADPRWPGHTLIENTYVIFTSDNGGYVQQGPEQITTNAPLREGKIHAEEGGTRVPLIIAGPEVPRGELCDVMVNGVDFYPTILSWTGTDPDANHVLDGADLAPLLEQDPRNAALVKGPGGGVRDTMVWHFPHSVAMQSTIRRGDYKLIRNWDHVGNPGKEPLELYRLYETAGSTQLRVDIEESRNLADTMPHLAAELNAVLETRLQDVKASCPYYNPAYAGSLPHKEAVAVVVEHGREGDAVWMAFEERGARVVRAQLIYTLNGGAQYEEWFRTSAELTGDGRVVATLPKATTHYVFNLIDENRFLVSFPDMGQQQDYRRTKARYSDIALQAEP